jgi:hypothetical protein
VIARSPKVDHPPLVPPKPDPDLMAAARTLVRALRDAGWQPVSCGNRWYAQRFVWAGEQDPQPLPSSCPAPPPTRPRRSRGPRA